MAGRASTEMTKPTEHLFAAVDSRKVAELLHDGPAQELAAMRLKLAALAVETPTDLPRRIDELKSLADAAAADIGRAIRILSGVESVWQDASWHPGSLRARLRELTEQFTATSGISCRFAIGADHLRFGAGVDEVLYRSIAELLTNVEKHAAATRVELRSGIRADGSCVISVADDGVGMRQEGDTAGSGGGFGLRSIAERLAELGGVLEIGGDRGFCVRLVLPAALRMTD